MAGFNSDIEKRISDACASAVSQNRPNISELARQFDVPYQRLRGRINGRPTLNQRRHYPNALDNTQEEALVQWVRRIDSMGISPTSTIVVQSANEILARSASDTISAEKPSKMPSKTLSKTPLKTSPKTPSNPPRTVGKNWVYRFMERLPADLHITTQKPIEKARFDAAELGHITHWFDLLDQEVRNGQYSPRNIYNFDETGIQIGQNSNQRVITQYPKRRLRGSDSRQSITIIEGVAADGFVMAPWFIFNGEVAMEHWFTSNCLPSD